MKSWVLKLNSIKKPARRQTQRLVVLFMAVALLVIAFLPWISIPQKYTIGDYQILCIGLSLYTFCALYVLRSKWRITVAGRALAYMSATFAFFVTWIFCSTNFGKDWFPLWTEIRVVVYGAAFISTFNMAWTLWEIQGGHIKRDASADVDAAKTSSDSQITE